jgi:hypothetical protein
MAPSPSTEVTPDGLFVTKQQLKILDFDIETRLVGFYEAGRFAPKGSEPTAVAGSFVGSDEMHVWAQPEYTVEEMLLYFADLWDEADIVTGHYIRKFDIPILNGNLFERGYALLGEKLVQDTKVDLREMYAISKSQENLSQMLELADGKYKMNDAKWRDATRLTDSGVRETYNRVTNDVVQHKALRQALLDAGVLNPPTLWKP